MKTLVTNCKYLFLLMSFTFFVYACNDDEGELPQVVASFTQVIDDGTGVVTFTNTSVNADTYGWEFGDGNISTEINPVHVYEVSGTYTVTLTATNVAGGSDTAEESISVNVDEDAPPPPPSNFDSGLLTNGDFETDGDNSWIAGVDPNSPAPTVTEDGNTFYSVNVTSPDPNAPFLVNMSQLVEIVSGNTYRLVFDAWSDVDRNIIAGIGLSDGDFANNSEMVAINSTRNTYELILCANGFGAPNARVLFDSNGEAGMVNIDNVALFIEDDTTDCTDVDDPPPSDFDFDGILLDNGGFQEVDGNGNVVSWIFGVDPNTPAPTALDGDDRFANYEFSGSDPSQPFAVNMSQFVEIVQGNTYRLRFEAWSENNRNIIAGIGLSDGNFANNSEMVAITTDPTVYMLDLEAAGFGASNARVLFDLFGEEGDVFIDDVSLEIIDAGGGGGAFDDGILDNGDFEASDANGVTEWIIGVDDNAPAPTVTEGGNTFYQVNITNPDPNQPFAVNVSQKVEIVQGNTYRLLFDAWSDVNRGIIAGIGLSGGNFDNNSQVINITPNRTTYELVLEATNFGAPDARVLFDVNGEAGLVNIDNVALFIEDDGGGGGGAGPQGGCTTSPIDAIALPVDFEGCESFLSLFGSGITSTLAENPDMTGINPSSFAYRVDKVAGADFFSGVQNNFAQTFPDITNRVFTMKIWSSKPNTTFRFEVAQDDPGVGHPQGVFATVADANTWTEVEFSFINIPAPEAYFRLVIKPDNNETDDPITSDGTYYFDDIDLN